MTSSSESFVRLTSIVAFYAVVASAMSFADQPMFDGAMYVADVPEAERVVSADFNNDGVPDIATLNPDDDSLSVMVGIGNGTWSGPDRLVYSAPEKLEGLFADDFNQDGNIDLVTLNNQTNNANNRIITFPGNGDGTFQAPVTTQTTFAYGGTVGDLNGDGLPDIVLGLSSFSIKVMRNDGDGTFSLGRTLTLTSNTIFQISIGDYNGDGIQDVATCHGVVSVFPGQGYFNFGAPTTTVLSNDWFTRGVVSGDFDNDGYDDLVSVNSRNNVGRNIMLLRGTPGGVLRTPLNFAVHHDGQVRAADVNADGNLDITVNSGRCEVSVLHGDGNARFDSGYVIDALYHDHFLADVDNNGLIDVLSVSDAVGLAKQLQPGVFEQAVRTYDGFSSTPGPYSLGLDAAGAADFNNDGVDDLYGVVQDDFAPDAMRIWVSNGDATFTRFDAGTANDRLQGIASSDINNDGYEDLVAVGEFSSRIYVLHGSGEGTFEEPVGGSVNAGGYPGNLVLADFDQDGFDDVIVWSDHSRNNSVTSKVVLKLNRGDGTFRPSVPLLTSDGHRLMKVGDFNNDSIPDVASADGDRLIVLISNGDGSFNIMDTQIGSSISRFNSSMDCADVDGDGTLDLVVGQGSSELMIYSGNGDGTFATSQQYDWSVGNAIRVTDVTGDAIPDILTADWIFTGKGDGTFERSEGYLTGCEGLAAIVTGHFDADNAIDIAHATYNFAAVLRGNISQSCPYQIENGVLIVRGTASPDVIKVEDSGNLVNVNVGGFSDTISKNLLSKIVVNGYGGNDTITIDSTLDACIDGGLGQDTIEGGLGINTIDGGPGADTIYGGPLGDTIDGGPGRDFVNGLGGDDTIHGGSADDELLGGGGNDHLIGGPGADILDGQTGDDTLEGGNGSDLLLGQSGDDLLFGQGGPDMLSGGTGNDQLSGGVAFDMLNGGKGTDTALDTGEFEFAIEIF